MELFTFVLVLMGSGAVAVWVWVIARAKLRMREIGWPTLYLYENEDMHDSRRVDFGAMVLAQTSSCGDTSTSVYDIHRLDDGRWEFKEEAESRRRTWREFVLQPQLDVVRDRLLELLRSRGKSEWRPVEDLISCNREFGVALASAKLEAAYQRYRLHFEPGTFWLRTPTPVQHAVAAHEESLAKREAAKAKATTSGGAGARGDPRTRP